MKLLGAVSFLPFDAAHLMDSKESGVVHGANGEDLLVVLSPSSASFGMMDGWGLAAAMDGTTEGSDEFPSLPISSRGLVALGLAGALGGDGSIREVAHITRCYV